MHRRGFLQIGALGALSLGLAACSGGGGGGPRSVARGGPDVLGVARANNLDRFVRAAQSAGLTETLAGAGPYTLFAPTDRAFGASDAGRMNDEALRALIAYHVVPGQLTSDFLLGMDVNHTSLLGLPLNVDGTDGLRINGATILRSDLMASNGVVFVIDRVLTPR